MGKAILSAIVTLIVGLLTMSIFTNGAEVGVLAAVAVMGGLVIYFNDRRRDD